MTGHPLKGNEIKLDILAEGQEPVSRFFPVAKGVVIIGRSSEADIIIEDTFVSKKHCALRLSDLGVILEDLESRNGTFVNGRKADAIELTTGDRIQLGKTTVVVNIPLQRSSIFDSKTSEGEFLDRDTGEYPSEELTHEQQEAKAGVHSGQKASKEKARRPEKKKDFDREAETRRLKGGDLHRGAPSGAPIPGFFDDEDEDDEEGAPYFDLVAKLIAEEKTKAGGSARAGEERVEVLSCVDGMLARVADLRAGEKFRTYIGDQKVKLLNYRKRGSCQLFLFDNFGGKVYTEGIATPVSKIMGGGTRARGGFYRHDLNRGDLAEIESASQTYYVRFVNSPELPSPRKDPQRKSHFMNTLGGSIAIHLAVFILLSIYLVIAKARADIRNLEDEQDRFVKLDLKDLEPKPPEPTPTPIETPVPKPVAEKQPEKPKVKKVQQRVFDKQAPKIIGVKQSKRLGGGGGGPVNVQNVGVLAALGGLTTDPTSTSNVGRVVSNLTAVKAPAGTRSSFSVSGLIGKGIDGDARIVRIAGPKGKGRGLDKDMGAIGVSIGGARGRGVGGVVDVGDIPVFEIGVRGGLSKEQIRKVVEEHGSELNACYEKGLYDDPTLEGKLRMQWEIGADGRVIDVRIKSASLKSTLVNGCVRDSIRRWQFPKPKGGGVVQVNFPFQFNSASF